MEVEAFVAHSGHFLKLNASDYVTGDDFKAALAQQSSIPSQYIVVLTAQGKPLRLQDVPLEERIFVYDIRISQPITPGRAPPTVEIAVPSPYTPTDPPNRINNAKSQESWQELFRTRQSWAERVLDDCAVVAQAATDRYHEMDVMVSCIDTAILNLESVLEPLRRKYGELQVWAAASQTEYNMLVTRWESYLSLARSISIDAGVAEFMTERKMSSKSRTGRPPTLEDLLDLETVKRTGRQAPQALRKFNQRVNELEKFATRTFQSLENTSGNFDQLMRRSALSRVNEPEQLLADIEAVVKTIDADYQATLQFSNTAKDLAQASKMAARHTERLLPALKDRAKEMDSMLRYATKERNALAVESVDWQRGFTDLTALTAQLKAQMKEIASEEELATFDYLRLIQQVPYLYASFAVEAIRRRTWYDNLEEDAAGVAEDVAQFQNEETERRKKWLRTVENLYSPQALSTSSVAAVLEINMLGQEKQWPAVTKKDLTEFHETLQRQKAEPELIKDVGELIEAMNKPTKLQLKRVKAFKNGSMHESALGRSGLIIRGDNEVRRKALEDEVKRLESKLKTADSRVKRLECVLHEKSAASMPSFQTLLQQSGQQFAASHGLSGSVQKLPQDRRRSSIDLPDHVLQRIQQLEGDLSAEKEKSSTLEQDLATRTTELQAAVSRMDEINSTKNDLLKNMDAQKRESVEERKSLEDEIKQLKDELEENEDKMYHVDESREHVKASYDAKIQDLEDQIAKLNKERVDEALKSEGQVDFLRKEAKIQREQIDTLERKLKATQDENKTVSKRLKTVEGAADAQLQALQDIHSRLAPDEKTPEDDSDLIESVTIKCSNVLEKIHNVEGDMSITKSELEEALNIVKDLRAEKTQIEQSLASEESTARQLRESLGEETARVGALESELDESRKQLSDLRFKISDGETGSDSLRKKLEEEEKKITVMAESLASKQSQVGSLEEELRLFKDKLGESRDKLGILKDRFVSRTEQTKDLTQKLYTQNDRLCRLLERMGFSITRKDGSMTMQKVPRAERSTSQNESMLDPGASIRRSSTLSKTPDSSDLELLYWMNNADQATETEKYQAFMSELGAFDMDAFTETVYKRVKDIEHLARKLQRDARSYREKAHVYQRASHDKVTVKNFKENDLVMFLPTRNEESGAWAAFNVGHPHYFLREQREHDLRNKDWLLARISRIQERVVDLSKSNQGSGTAENESLDGENDNPFDLSDGLRWYLIDAVEDKPGAPSTPGLGKTTVAANKVDAVAEKSHARAISSGKALGLVSRPTGIDGVSKTLSKSLESRRSSTSSRRALPFGIGSKGSALASDANSVRAAANESPDADAAAAEASTAAGQANGGAEDSAGQEERRPAQDAPQAPEVRSQSGPLDNLLGP
ncbi:unnamed protein product [Discula destructiva]